MTRWKREFRRWAKTEGLTVYSMPRTMRRRRDWEVAKTFSQLMSYLMR